MLSVLPILFGSFLLPFVTTQYAEGRHSGVQNGGSRLGSRIAGITWAGSTRSETDRPGGSGFNIGRTSDGQEGYVGLDGGVQGMPWFGGSGYGSTHADGGVRLGRAYGTGSGSIWAYRQRMQMGINDDFPHDTGPPPSVVLNRGSGRINSRTTSVSRSGGMSSSRLSHVGMHQRHGMPIGGLRMPFAPRLPAGPGHMPPHGFPHGPMSAPRPYLF